MYYHNKQLCYPLYQTLIKLNPVNGEISRADLRLFHHNHEEKWYKWPLWTIVKCGTKLCNILRSYIGGKKLLRGHVRRETEFGTKSFDFVAVLVSYLNDLVDGFLVDGQAGKGIFTEALGEGTKCQ